MSEWVRERRRALLIFRGRCLLASAHTKALGVGVYTHTNADGWYKPTAQNWIWMASHSEERVCCAPPGNAHNDVMSWYPLLSSLLLLYWILPPHVRTHVRRRGDFDSLCAHSARSMIYSSWCVWHKTHRCTDCYLQFIIGLCNKISLER